jgi:PHD/YefM family antitoxin component YafN of YafNO toxin-antitoxin module
MGAISANELKKRGVSALAPALEEDGEAVITVRGKSRYVVMTIEKYNRVREAELAEAVREARADYKAGRVADDTVEGHMRRLRDEV